MGCMLMIRNIFMCIGEIFSYIFHFIFSFLDIILGTKYVIVEGHKLPKTQLDFILQCLNFLFTISIIVFVLIILYCIANVLYNCVIMRYEKWLKKRN